jgi:hypothetical protein
MKLDENLKSEDFSTDTGSTACVVLITKNKIFCANALTKSVKFKFRALIYMI